MELISTFCVKQGKEINPFVYILKYRSYKKFYLLQTAICTASPEALPFLISLLRPNNPLLKSLKTPMTIIENAGGILRNVSTEISTSPELRKILRENHCYEILLEHLKSCSLTVVSNACGTLWNLSDGVGCEEDQRKLLDLNAVPMLKNLIYSKHQRISQGASTALRNLLSSRFAKEHMLQLDSRLTAQIYSPANPGGTSDRGICGDSNQESPGSDNDFEFEYGGNMNHQHAQYQQQQPQLMHHPPMVQQHEPPVAHQHSSAAAASIFQRIHTQPAHTHSSVAPTHFHAPPNFAHPGNYVNRPTSINYSMEPEPLDLTLTSAKSSPIHIISAAEFGNMTGHHHQHLHHSHPHHRKPKSAPFSHGVQYHGHNSSGGHKQFFNPPALLHQTGSSSQCSSPMRFSYPGAKFNRSCPEILSRLSSGHTQMNTFVPDQKPLDFSSNPPSASSSLRGAGEAVGSQNDSANGGDTTFNYSLQYIELDDDDRGNTTGNGEGVSKSEDTLKTYCYEGTPHNFSISNSCQDLVHEIEVEKAAAGPIGEKIASSSTNNNTNKSPKLQPIDEAPKSYYVENTPAVFSRTSSLSSINSSGGLNAGENKAEPLASESADEKKSGSVVDDCHGSAFHHGPQQGHSQPKRRSGPQQGTFTPGRVTFSAEETPLMFSRCSSVASLDSLDVGVVGSGGGGNGLASQNDDDLSDFSRRASEVVSPSDLPDSPRAMAPPVRIYDQPVMIHGAKAEKPEGEDDIKIFSIEEKSGLNSCRSLSPLMIDDEVLPVLSKRKLESDRAPAIGDTNQCSNLSKTCQPIEQTASSREGSTKQEMSETNSNIGEPEKKVFSGDEVKVFAMEGTPFYGVSNATSLSDLMADIDTTDDRRKQPLTTEIEGVPNTNSIAPTQSACQVKLEEAGTGKEVPVTSVPIVAQLNEPIYSDVQLLQKCIRIGKAAGIPKSKSEYKITSESTQQPPSASNETGSSNNLVTRVPGAGKKVLTESKSQHDFDDPDLAALIMKGRNRPKEKERNSSKSSKAGKAQDKEDVQKSSKCTNKSSSESDTSKTASEDSTKNKAPILLKEDVRVEIKELDDKVTKSGDSSEQTSSEESKPEVESEEKPRVKMESLNLDPSQISTTSLGSEWNDETPTFSSPIPSMSISAAFKIVGGGLDESIYSKKSPPVPPKVHNKLQASMQSSMLTASVMNNELIDNVDPPSTFSNLVSSSDCILAGSPPLNPKLQGSASDKLSRKWKALNDAANTSSIYSNLSGQRPPLDLDLENSMMSVASIKSEIYELSSTASFTNDIFQSAVEDIGSPTVDRILGGGDTSIGGNTYTIFPPENMIGDNGKSADVISEGGNTVVSDDFTDAEEIEDYETAPADDNIGHLIQLDKCNDTEKSDAGKPDEVDNVKGSDEIAESNKKIEKTIIPPTNSVFLQQQTGQPKPLMEVHPLELGNKYGTFKVAKTHTTSPRASPKQKRRDDPERYKTHTIAALQSGKSLIQQEQSNDNNGNPLDDTRFATFRVGGPKIVKPTQNANSNVPSVKSSQSNSPESTPGNSPKGIRGRRKPLYSSLPPSAINKKKVAPPVPPKPTRNASPVRPPSTGSGVYVRPTRTSELRIAANSRENSPARVGGTSSRTSSNSSLNLIHNAPQKHCDQECSTFASPRPKIAPKPPIRTSASVSSSSGVKPFSGSTYNVLIKTSNSSFGFGQQKVVDGSVTQNMKGYSTLPKSSKLGGEYAGMYMPGSVPNSQNGESKESIPGSEKSQGKMGKLSNLFKKMDFHRNKEVHDTQSQAFQDHGKQGDATSTNSTTLEKKSSKFSFFGRKKDKSQPKPFLDSQNRDSASTSCVAAGNTASIRGPSGIWVRRDGENKAMVAPFNYVPPLGHPIRATHQQYSMDQNSQTTVSNSHNNANVANSENNVVQVSNSSAAGSAKITTV